MVKSRANWKTDSEYSDYEEVRRKLIIAAAEVIEEVGVDKLRLSQVAKKCGYARQSIYRYFDSKFELVQAVLLYLTIDNANMVVEKVAEISDLEELLVEIIYLSAKNLSSNPKYKIITDPKNAVIFNNLPGGAISQFIEGYKFSGIETLMTGVRDEISLGDIYTWLTMQVLALVNLGLVSTPSKTRRFIRQMIVRGPTYFSE